MLNFLRKIRRQEFKGRYLKYAIGEILLVVIGILIALSINNWNEARKESKRLLTYEGILVTELEGDLRTLEAMGDFNDSIRGLIDVYLAEYSTKEPDIDKIRQLNIGQAMIVNTFGKQSFTLDEITQNGSLSLFPDETKQAILSLKFIHELFVYYERQSLQRVLDALDQRDQHIDFLYEKGYVKEPHPNAAKWYQTLESDNYRLLNNAIARTLVHYDYQEQIVFPTIKRRTEELLTLLKAP